MSDKKVYTKQKKGLSKLALIIFALVFTAAKLNAQTPSPYPRMAGYFSVTNAIETYSNGHFNGNFGNVYTVSFPFGLNLLKSDHFGVSFELSPTIRTENHIAKVSSITFHPGAMFRFPHGFTFIGRVAFETNGRFGFTPVFNKIVVRGKNSSFFASIPFPVRFGNNLPSSIGTGLQLGVVF